MTGPRVEGFVKIVWLIDNELQHFFNATVRPPSHLDENHSSIMAASLAPECNEVKESVAW